MDKNIKIEELKRFLNKEFNSLTSQEIHNRSKSIYNPKGLTSK